MNIPSSQHSEERNVSITYFITNQDGNQSLTVFGPNGSWQKPVAGTHPNFGTLVSYLTGTPSDAYNEEYIRGLVDPTIGVGKILKEHFGDRVAFDLHYLHLDGRRLEGPAARAIVNRMLSGDQEWVRFVRFLVNLDSNPSKRAQDATWQWVEKNGLTITEDGRFLGYKAVQNDGFSSSAGPNNYVNGELYRDGAETTVPHEIGSVISKRRADVDDTPGGGCSTGLHVGTESYARGFAPRLMTVAVNPRDVVSAPDNDLEWKIRVCEYEVVSLADPAQFAGTSYDLQDTPLEDQRSLVEVLGEETDAITEPSVDLVTPPKGTGLLGRVVLRDWARVNPGLRKDLHSGMGHSEVARKYSQITTESSVRRYRKSID